MTILVAPKLDLGDRVRIDRGDIVGTVIGIAIYHTGTEAKVSWWNNGTLVEQWVADWRCEVVPR